DTKRFSHSTKGTKQDRGREQTIALGHIFFAQNVPPFVPSVIECACIPHRPFGGTPCSIANSLCSVWPRWRSRSFHLHHCTPEPEAQPQLSRNSSTTRRSRRRPRLTAAPTCCPRPARSRTGGDR